MWERRLELKKYAKNAIDQDFNKEELERLRNEVHKLEVKKLLYFIPDFVQEMNVFCGCRSTSSH